MEEVVHISLMVYMYDIFTFALLRTTLGVLQVKKKQKKTMLSCKWNQIRPSATCYEHICVIKVTTVLRWEKSAGIRGIRRLQIDYSQIP